jgi:hypothetical protein
MPFSFLLAEIRARLPDTGVTAPGNYPPRSWATPIILRSGTASCQPRPHEKERRWRRLYRWRAGIEGRIYSLQRDYGLERCAYHGEHGLERGVGWGILASNLAHIGHALVA